MFSVYLIKSLSFPDQTYVGYTENLESRMLKHNSGGSPHTAKFMPWKLVVHIQLIDEKKAIELEKYLKSQSGRAFAKNVFGRFAL